MDHNPGSGGGAPSSRRRFGRRGKALSRWKVSDFLKSKLRFFVIVFAKVR